MKRLLILTLMELLLSTGLVLEASSLNTLQTQHLLQQLQKALQQQLLITLSEPLLTNLTIVGDAGGSDVTYTDNLVLTGGNVTVSNNITYLLPETLGVVNLPLENVTGTRSVTGSFTCYFNAESNSSADLFENIIEDTDQVTNSFDLNDRRWRIF